MPDTPEQVSKRFEMPLRWAQCHAHSHICVDGRTYSADCLVTDPEMDEIARWFIEGKPVKR